MRYIAINPEKTRRFTTKGINLSLVNPVAMIPPDLEPEFMQRIAEGLKSGEIFEISDKHIEKAGQAKIEMKDDTDEASGLVGVIASEPNEEGKRRILHHTITMMPEDEDEEIKVEKKKAIILTDIVEEYDEE